MFARKFITGRFAGVVSSDSTGGPGLSLTGGASFSPPGRTADLLAFFTGDRPLRANIPETSLVPLINEQGEKEKGRNEREFSWCCSFLWGFGCRGTERRRAKRAAARTLNMNDRLRVQVPYRVCWRQL